MKLSMNLTGALLVVLLALSGGCGGLSHTAATAALEPLPVAHTPIMEYIPKTMTLNDCHMSGIRGPFEFNDQSIGQFPWTKTGAVQEIGGTSDVLLTGQQPDPNGCVGWIILLVHGPSGTATMSGGSRCPDGMRSCGFQTSGQVVRVR
jgi:hypothetical protein